MPINDIHIYKYRLFNIYTSFRANHLVRLSDKIDSINNDSSSRSIMQVKSIEMTLTKLDKGCNP